MVKLMDAVTSLYFKSEAPERLAMARCCCRKTLVFSIFAGPSRLGVTYFLINSIKICNKNRQRRRWYFPHAIIFTRRSLIHPDL